MDKRYSKHSVIDPVDCTGCGLCAHICPSKCISMKEGKLGHLFPSVDSKKCIHCNLCVKKCPSKSPIRLGYPLAAYAAWVQDEDDYLTSTSGGAASALSHDIISRGGVVYGCTMGESSVVKHIRVEDSERCVEMGKSQPSQRGRSDHHHDYHHHAVVGGGGAAADLPGRCS